MSTSILLCWAHAPNEFPETTFQFPTQPTAWKKSKYGVISGLNTGKYGPEITPYLETFHAVTSSRINIQEPCCEIRKFRKFRILMAMNYLNSLITRNYLNSSKVSQTFSYISKFQRLYWVVKQINVPWTKLWVLI